MKKHHWGFGMFVAVACYACEASLPADTGSTVTESHDASLEVPKCHVTADCMPTDAQPQVCFAGFCSSPHTNDCRETGCYRGAVCALDSDKRICPDCPVDAHCMPTELCEKLECTIDADAGIRPDE